MGFCVGDFGGVGGSRQSDVEANEGWKKEMVERRKAGLSLENAKSIYRIILDRDSANTGSTQERKEQRKEKSIFEGIFA